MAVDVFRIALLLWSGLFIIAGSMLMIASQLGHIAEAVAASGRVERPAPAPRARRVSRAVRGESSRRPVRSR